MTGSMLTVPSAGRNPSIHRNATAKVDIVHVEAGPVGDGEILAEEALDCRHHSRQISLETRMIRSIDEILSHNIPAVQDMQACDGDSCWSTGSWHF